MTIHNPATREEWLSLRHRYVSSTESAALHGLSPYLTAFELFHNKKQASYVEFEANERMAWGIRQEEAIARGVAEEYGVKVRKLNSYVSRDGTGMGSSFDYEIVGVKDGVPPPQGTVLQEAYTSMGPGILEIKNVDWLVYKRTWLEDEAPAHIEIQVQHQLHVIERKWAAMGILVGGNNLKMIVREYDPAVGQVMQDKVRQFWKDLKSGNAPPPVLPQDADLISHIYNFGDPDKTLDAQGNAEVETLCKDYLAAGKAEKEAKDAKDTAKAKLLQIVGDASKIVVDGGISISAGTVGEAEIAAYTRNAYRNFRVTQKAPKEAK